MYLIPRSYMTLPDYTCLLSPHTTRPSSRSTFREAYIN